MKTTAIIPVHNEERTIGAVLNALVSNHRISNVIVVDDGSTDNTPEIVKRFKVKMIRLNKRVGKGDAVKIGAKNVKSGIILLIDADLVGLKKEHINKILDPFTKSFTQRNVAMAVGLRDKGNFIVNMLMPYLPLIGGERAIAAEAFNEILKNPLIKEWGLESVMNDYCRKKKLKIVKVKLHGMDHLGILNKKFELTEFSKKVYSFIITRIKLLNSRN